MKYFVYYHTDYEEYGLEIFDNEDKALDWINNKLQRMDKPDLNRFTLIEGFYKELVGIEVVTKVRVAR